MKLLSLTLQYIWLRFTFLETESQTNIQNKQDAPKSIPSGIKRGHNGNALFMVHNIVTVKCDVRRILN